MPAFISACALAVMPIEFDIGIPVDDDIEFDDDLDYEFDLPVEGGVDHGI